MQEFEFSEKIMGTELDISIISNDVFLAQKQYNESLSLAREYENIFSRFKKNSQLSVVNEKKHTGVSVIFVKVFKEAKRLFQESGGLFNPLVQIKNFGYDKDFAEIKDRKLYNIDYLEADLDFSKTHIIDDEIFLSDYQELDFGGFLKGYVALEMSEVLDIFPGYIVNLGGDIYTKGCDQFEKKFSFSIFDPVNDNYDIKVVVHNMAISTSGTYKRKWRLNGKEVSHILSSDNEILKTDLVSATVITDNPSTADAWATVAVSLGSENAVEFLNQRNVSYILIKANGVIIRNI